jgi:hypothetical protein
MSGWRTSTIFMGAHDKGEAHCACAVAGSERHRTQKSRHGTRVAAKVIRVLSRSRNG